MNRLALSAMTITAAGVLLAATACSSDDDVATPVTTVAPTTTAPPAITAPPTTTPPSTTTAAPATTLPTTTPLAPPIDEARQALLSGILESHHAAGEFVGARIAVQDPDGAITEVAAGTQTVDPGSPPVDLDIPWNVGSATKTFVAVVVLQLADEDRLDLDAPVVRFFPELPGADRITPRQLLQHTSGLGEYLDHPTVQSDLTREWAPAELIAVAEAAGRFGEPGGPHHYSNTNYIVLGEIIQQVTGSPWYDEVGSRIAEPLGMTGTGYIGDDHPVGYRLIDGTLVDWTYSSHPSVGGATGALQSTGRDLLRFAAALRDGTLLSPESQAAMQAFVPAEDLSRFGIDHGYGLGLERHANDAMTAIGHMGVGEAQSAYVGYDANRGTAVAAQMNVAVPGPQALMAFEALVAVGQPE